MGIQWLITGKIQMVFFTIRINWRSMKYHWEYFSGTYFDSVLMEIQLHITGNILMVLITIHLLGEFNNISLKTLWCY